MSDNPYRTPTAVSGSTVEADLGAVAARVGNTSDHTGPDLPTQGPITPIEIGHVAPDIVITDRPQRAARPIRAKLDILAARPQNQPAMRAYLTSYTTHTPVSTAGLDVAALSIDPGADMRFIVDATTTVAAPLGGGAYGWTPAQGSDDLAHISLDICPIVRIGGVGDATFSVTPDEANFYYSRLGALIRPSVDIFGSFLLPSASGAYTGDNPLFAATLSAFTVALVADIDETAWDFCDLVSVYSTAATPGAAKSATLRLKSDRVQIYGNHRLCFDEFVTEAVEGPSQALNLPARRPSIIVLSMSADGVGAVAIVTPKVSYHDTLAFPAASPWPQTGRLKLGWSNFDPTGITDFSLYAGAAAVWNLLDISLWGSALSVHECVEVATQLDSVYGVHR